VPLPFFSYGGTAIATTLAAVGVLLSVARRGTSAGIGLRDKGRNDASLDSWRRDRRTPLSGARGRAGISR
jgi:hypothetical protein